MREYVIREGSMYAGTHNVYEYYDEYRSAIKNTYLNIHKWRSDDYKKYQVRYLLPNPKYEFFHRVRIFERLKHLSKYQV